MKLLVGTFLSFLSILTAAGHAADIKIYKGKWNERHRTSLKITNPDLNQVQYCYRRGCDILAYEGSTEKMTFKGRSFLMRMSKVGKTYHGWYKHKPTGKVSTAVLK